MKKQKVADSTSRAVLGKQSKFDVKNKKKNEPEPVDANAYAIPPWPQWSDSDLNMERWDVHVSQASLTSKEKLRSSFSVQAHNWFEDPMGHVPLPPSLEPASWRRLYYIPNMQVYHEYSAKSPTLDLATPNHHLLHSEVMRWILSGIMNLYQLARAHGMELEGEGQDFYVPSRPWKPWHHIYSMCKVTKGTTHKAEVNPAGKYCVRLFYMGCWRRLTVDDFLPLDSDKRPLLPMTPSCKEMWPVLLSKALLKVAALSWTEHNEIHDFNVMACLTGWYAQELDLYKVPARSVWWLCQKLLMSDCEDPEERYSGVKDVNLSVAYETMSVSFHEPLPSPSVRTTNTDPAAEVLGSVVLCAVLKTFPTELLPCEEHPVLITKARITPNEDRPATPLWKTFRWKKWAFSQGLIADPTQKYVKYVRMYSALQNCQPDQTLGVRIRSVEEIPLAVPKPSKAAQKASKAAHQKEKDAEISRQKEEKNSFRPMMADNHSQEDLFPEFWIDFENVVHGIKRFEIFYKTKSFEHNLNVNDITELLQEKVIPAIPSNKSNVKEHPHIPATPSNKSTAKEHPHIPATPSNKSNIKVTPLSPPPPPPRTPTMKGGDLNRGRDDVLYFLVDSMANKKLLVSLSVLNPSSCSFPPSVVNLYGSANEQGETSRTSLSTGEYSPPTYYILWENYNWQSNQIRDISFAVKTAGTTCHLLQLREGLRVYRLWLNLPKTYVIRISSQTPFILGTRDRIQEVLAEESLSWKHYGSRFSDAFNALTNIEHDSPNHQELLENMRKSYLPMHIPKPSSKLAALLRKEIHSRFEKTLVQLLVDMTESSEVIAQVLSEWRWLFHKEKFGTNIRLESKAGEVLDVHASGSDKDVSPIISRSKRGSDSQLGSYRYCDSLDYVIQVPSIGERTKMITFDQQSGTEFLRRMLGNDPEILRFYPFRSDDYHHISFTDYKGVVRNSTGEWFPLVRFVVHVHSNTNPFCGIYLTSSLEEDVIQVVNNDNLQQIPRFIGDIEPSYFPPNRRGYTIFAHGLDNGQKDHTWKIRLVSVPQQQLPHACSWSSMKVCIPDEPPELAWKEVTGHYMPNKENSIYKCLLTIETSQDLSLRTVMSNNHVEFVLRISAGDEDVIKEYFATGEIIIPVVQLKGRDSGGPSFYAIEAQVLRKTWTLSPEEVEIVNTLRDKDRQELLVFDEEGNAVPPPPPTPPPPPPPTPEEVEPLKPSASTFTQRIKRQRKTIFVPTESDTPLQRPDLEPNAPFWSLTLVMNKDNSSTVTLEKDQRRAEEIRQIKAQWEAAEPGRYQRSLKIRKEFFEHDRYSSYLRGFIHDQGLEDGEKTKYLLEHLSYSEGDHEPDLFEVDRKGQKRKLIEEFENEYKEIKMKFENIKEKQSKRQRAIANYLAEVKNESRALMDKAYNGRMMCVENIIEQIQEAKRLLDMQNKTQKQQSRKSKKRA